MPNLNSVHLMGLLTRDPELRYTPGGKAVSDVGLAINHYSKTDDGQKKEEVTFVDVTLWGSQAEVVAKYCKKGSPLFVDGRLQLDTWDDRQSGQKRSKLKVVGETIQLLGGKPDTGSVAPASQTSAPAARTAKRGSAQPVGRVQPARDPDLDAEPDDIPFKTTVYRDVRQSRLNRRIF
jgi:single-strand DNA-binding protein